MRAPRGNSESGAPLRLTMRVARVFALQHCRQRQSRLHGGGQVFQAVHRDIDPVLEQGAVDLLGEERAAAYGPQRYVDTQVAGRRDGDQLHRRRVR